MLALALALALALTSSATAGGQKADPDQPYGKGTPGVAEATPTVADSQAPRPGLLDYCGWCESTGEWCGVCWMMRRFWAIGGW